MATTLLIWIGDHVHVFVFKTDYNDLIDGTIFLHKQPARTTVNLVNLFVVNNH